MGTKPLVVFSWFWFICCFIVATIVVFVRYDLALDTVDFSPSNLSFSSSVNKHPPSIIKEFSIVSEIETSEWNINNPSTENIKGIIAGSKPVVIRRGPAHSWRIASWSINDFLNTGSDLIMEDVRFQRVPVFILGREREKGGMLGSPQDLQLKYVNTTLGAFYSTRFDPSQFYYWTTALNWMESVLGQPLTQFVDESSEKAADWTIFKVVDEKLKYSIEVEDEDIWRPMLWLSHPGVVAQTHYDPQHNFLSQLQGSKRVILFAPSEQCYPYPHIHRSYRQSQLHLERGTEGVNRSVFPTLPKGLEVTLHRGDTLYIPPYWNHRVESLSTSLSLSVTSPTSIEAAFAEIYWQNLPFGAFSNTRSTKSLVVQLFLALVIDKSHFKMTLREYSKWLYDSRYHPLYSQRMMDQTPTNFRCTSYPAEGSELDILLTQHSDGISEAALHAASLLNNMNIPIALQMTFVGDYVEEISRWAVGVDYTMAFIRECLI